MCNRYVTPSDAEIERQWHIGRQNPPRWWSSRQEVFPRAPGPFLRAAKDGGIEPVVGSWGLIPVWSKTPELRYNTNNARSEEIAEKASYKLPWAKGQRCIIPALTFDEPNWESGKNQWWRFARADGQLWGLAGLWNAWIDRATGEVHESYTMLTINADNHPLMSRMHKPDPALAANQQDKRSVIPIELSDVEQWLNGNTDDAQALLKLAPAEIFNAGPMA